MAFAPRVTADRPLSEVNTTPLIDVMLVLLVMLVRHRAGGDAFDRR